MASIDGMASLRAAEEAILVAVETATVDAGAPEAEKFRFEPAALARLTAMFKRPGGEDLVIKAWHTTQRQLFDRVPIGQPNEAEAAQPVLRLLQAHLALQQRLTAVRDIRYRATDHGLERLPIEDVPIEDDPWLAERNFGPD